ncbi:MAG TPA: alpha-E domain-containing protein, partial [Rhodospirillaceae bacterium]|nr:alpha-E domain-containing protein [Rhodospirillaceae bacterium]
MANLLARLAESVFWLARYMERVENMARILDVTETFARDRSGRNWLSVVQINSDDRRFFAQHPTASAEAVLEFYLL